MIVNEQTLAARTARAPLAVARILAAAYGYQLDPVVYTQGVAVSGRLRLAPLDTEGADPTPSIVALVEPYVAGTRPLFADQDGGANLAGLVWADELATATGDRRYADLLVNTANRYTVANDGVPAPSDPDYRVEDMFFSGTMLGRAFRLTGDERYLDILTQFLLNANVQQADGLFWHARSAPYYWGRGNGFAALGFAETLTYLPADHRDRAALLAIHQRHLDALHPYQDASGLWRQVINVPDSYLELSVTCIIGYVLARGMRLGWLDGDYHEALRRAWRGVNARIDDEGGLAGVCVGTGVQQSLRDYLERPATFGPDERGGALALWFAVEMEEYLRMRRDLSIQQALNADETIDITTIGRKSGQPWRIEIWFRRVDGRIYITGTPGPRDWFANLQANPHFVFHLKQSASADLPATALVITDEAERRRILADPVMHWYHQQVGSLETFVADSPLVEVLFDES